YYRTDSSVGQSVRSILTFAKPDITKQVGEMISYADNLRSKLTAHSARHPPFAPSLPQVGSHIDQFVKTDFTDYQQLDNLVKTFVTALSGLPNQDPGIQGAVT